MNPLVATREQMIDELRGLLALWGGVQAEWDDAVRQEFERTFMAAYEQAAPPLFAALETLAALYDRARRDEP